MARSESGREAAAAWRFGGRVTVLPSPAQVELILDRGFFAVSIQAIAKRATVLDLGAHTPLQKNLARYRPLFADTRYLCTDVVPAPGLDFVANATDIPLRGASIDGVICLSLLEHVFEPWRVAQEIHRVLKPEGVAFLYVPFLYEYHGAQGRRGTPDCYRFSIDAVRYLFRAFAHVQIQPVGRAVESALRLVVARYGPLDRLARKTGRLIDRLRGPESGIYQASGYNLWLEKG